MAVKAPFRFARISRRVHEPVWGPLATHDIPFADGVSGTATLTLTAITPLLIGGAREKASNDAPGWVRPYEVGGKYAIPPSTMQGLCRSILEIAAFGRLGPFVDDRKFGIRDLSLSETARLHYKERLSTSEIVGGRTHITPRTKAGFLVKDGDGEISIIPCKMARIHVNEVKELKDEKLKSVKKNPPKYNALLDGTTADVRYDFFLNGLKGGKSNLKAVFDIPKKKTWHDHKTHKKIGRHPDTRIVQNENPIKILYRQCIHSSTGVGESGMLVLTGKPGFNTAKSKPLDPGMKKWEFVFYRKKPNKSMIVEDSEWKTFLQIHDPNHEKPPRRGVIDKEINPTWKYWKADFKRGDQIPVFYLSEDGKNVDTFGMAYMFKAAHEMSTRDLLAHSCKDHNTEIKDALLDMPHLIFGVAAEGEGGRGLKRRAWFGLGISSDGPENKPKIDLGAAILLSPKPSYVGIYVRQQADGDRIPDNEPFASYTPVDINRKRHLKEPELAGVKIWPVSHPQIADVQLPPLGDLANNNSVQTQLYPVPKGTEFSIPLNFHNLRPVELGALLWALSFGDDKAFGGDVDKVSLHHRLGMGKPFGLGEVAISVDLKLDGDARTAKEFVTCFETYMQEVYQGWGGNSWQGSKQVKALIKAADPARNNSTELKYMKLNTQANNGNSIGTYVGEKGTRHIQGGFLPDYAGGHEFPRSSDSPGPRPDTPTGPVLEPVEGARVRLKATGNGRHNGMEGVVTRYGGKVDHAKHTIRLSANLTLKRFARQFDVIKLPDGG